MNDAPLLSAVDLIDDSIAIDKIAKATDVDRNKVREVLAELATLPGDRVKRMCLGAYDHRVKAMNRKTRRRR